MAHMDKYTHPVAAQIMAHNNRTSSSLAQSEHIDPSRTHLNYSLLPDRGMSDYEYYRQRKSELYCYGRSNLITLVGWVCTLPREVKEEQEYKFFLSAHEFFCRRYGEANIVQSIVHKDEEGRPHLHVCFIPATEDTKHGGEKVCANSVVTRHDLITFHSDLQKWLDERGIKARVSTGISAVVGRNLTVEEIKHGELDIVLGDIDFKFEKENSPTIDWNAEADAILNSLPVLEIPACDAENEYEIEF